ncbi:MAG: ribosome maturation factor RimM [Rhizobiaceae bacterium]
MKLTNPILMAQIGAPHGIKGEVRVKSFTGDPLALGDYGSLYDKDGRKFKIMRLRPANTVIVVKFKGINFRDEAQALNGTELFIDRSMLPNDEDEGEFYVADLIGCDVLVESGEQIGTIVAAPDFGAGCLLEIAPLLEAGGFGSDIWYLKFTPANVPKVDLEKHAITITLPREVSERDEES